MRISEVRWHTPSADTTASTCRYVPPSGGSDRLRSGSAFGLCQMAGGINKIEDADNDEGFQRALKFAVVQYNNGTNDTVLHQVLKVVSAEHQVVEGSKHIMTVLLGRTNCEKEAPAENCGVYKEPGHARPHRCKFEVWSRPWLNDTRLTKNECDSIERTTE
ncbi:cystatin-like [Anableps anableps]